MLGYKKTTRLIFIEYLMAMLLHAGYAFFMRNLSDGFYILTISFLLFSFGYIFFILCKKELPVMVMLHFIVSLSTLLVGIRLKTLGHSMFIMLCLLAGLTIFMEKHQMFCSLILSIIMFFASRIFFWDIISLSVPSLYLYYTYGLIYLIASLNLYFIVKYAKQYMLGMDEKAREAELASESKRLFLANMSHEIRTPMNAICGMAELNLKEDLSPQVRENTLSIQSSGKILLAIVNDILDYSKIESGKMDIIPVTYSISHLIKDCCQIMSVRLLDKDVKLTANLADDVPDVLIGDEVRVRQILFNIMNNAMKFTDHGSIDINVTGEKITNDDIKLFLSVKDTGIGIRDEDLHKLFTSFQQLDTHKSHAREGTGLGLAICKQLSNLMGGDISVESTYGEGSTFVVTIIQKINHETTKLIYSETTSENRDEHITTHDVHALVVDDNKVNLKVADGLLKTFGIEVTTCLSGRACLEKLNGNHTFDIIFLDHMMPELDGIETLKLIRSEDSDYMRTVPVIALTANVMSGVREMFIEEGFDDYVPKPIDTGWLNTILNKYLPENKIG